MLHTKAGASISACLQAGQQFLLLSDSEGGTRPDTLILLECPSLHQDLETQLGRARLAPARQLLQPSRLWGD